MKNKEVEERQEEYIGSVDSAPQESGPKFDISSLALIVR